MNINTPFIPKIIKTAEEYKDALTRIEEIFHSKPDTQHQKRRTIFY